MRKLFQGSDHQKNVNLRSLFFELVYNVAMVMVAGKRGSGMDDLFGPSKLMDINDFIPLLRWMGFTRMERKIVNLHERRDCFLQGLIDEGRQKIAGASPFERRHTYVQELLSIQQSDPEYYTDEILKGLILASLHLFCFKLGNFCLTIIYVSSIYIFLYDEFIGI